MTKADINMVRARLHQLWSFHLDAESNRLMEEYIVTSSGYTTTEVAMIFIAQAFNSEE